MSSVQSALAQLEARHDEVSKQQAAIKTDINNSIAKLIKTLEARKDGLISQLDLLTEAKLKSLSIQKDQIEAIQAQLNGHLQSMREKFKNQGGKVLLAKSATVKQVKELITKVQADELEPNTEADVIFSTLANLTMGCQNYGQVSVDPSDPSKCSVVGKGIETALVGEKSTAVFETLNSNNQPCKIPIHSITCELVSEITGARARGIVERRKPNQYEISYQPTIKGRHQLHIKVEGKYISESPYPIPVRSPREKLGSPIQTIRGVNKPCGVAVNQRGEVVVAEYDGNCISVESLSGESL